MIRLALAFSVFYALVFYVPATHAANLYIYSASSMAAALEDITQNHPQKNLHRVHIVSAATSALARQIMRGAPADIFIAAHPDWIKQINSRKTTILAHNRLVLAAHRAEAFTFTLNSPAAALQNALKGKRLALSDTAIPAGFYAKQALSHYQLWKQAQQIAVFGTNARTTLSWLTRGHVAAAIIYASDLHNRRDLRLVARFAPESHQPIIYQMALVSSSDAAQKLWTFLKSDAARAGLKNWGFETTR